MNLHTMKIFDIAVMPAERYEERDKNVFYEKPEFKMRVLVLRPGERIPRCRMSSHVVFVCIQGCVELRVNKETKNITAGQCLATEPATISMHTDSGARLLGIQIMPQKRG